MVTCRYSASLDKQNVQSRNHANQRVVKLGENILYQSHVVHFSVCATLEKPIVSIYVVRGFEWLGHVPRMDDERTAKKLLGGKPGGRKKYLH